MSYETRGVIWLIHAIISTSALLFVLQMIFADMTPSPAAAMMILGITLKCLFDRRECRGLAKAEG
jgi:hypothetical protein